MRSRSSIYFPTSAIDKFVLKTEIANSKAASMHWKKEAGVSGLIYEDDEEQRGA